MKSSWSTELLIEFENSSSDLLVQRSPETGVMFWPLLRWPLSRQFAKQEFGVQNVARPADRSTFLGQAARGFLGRLSAGSAFSTPADHLFLVSGTTEGDELGKAKNWLVDDYAAALGQNAVVIQERPLSKRPRVVARTTSSAEMLAALQLSARIRSRSRARSNAPREFLEEVIKSFPGPGAALDAEALARGLEYQARWSALCRDSYLRIIDKLEPSVVYIQSACYGDRSPLIEALHERDIVVAEHQHGWIGPYHAAYNFGRAFQSGRLNSVLPDALITFGDYWTQGLRFPNSLLVAGKPHLSRAVRHAPDWKSRSKRVLVVSSVVHPELMEQKTLELNQALPNDWTVLFRPHPSERPVVESRYPALAASPHVKFDLTPDVYESLASARAVVGTLSTVLFEALAFSCTVVPLEDPLNSMYLGDLLGAPVATARDVAATVQLPPGSRDASSEEVRESIWGSSSAESLLRVMKEVEAMSRRTT